MPGSSTVKKAISESTYDRIMKKMRLKDHDRAVIIENFLDNWSKGSGTGIRIVDNIRSDKFVPETVLLNLLDQIYRYQHLSIEKFEIKYREVCYKFSLEGDVMDQTQISKHVGGAKTVEDFKKSLIGSRKYMNEDRASKLITKLRNDKKRLTKGEKTIPVAQHSSWVTWSESDEENPFDFVTAPLEILKLLSNLGLSHTQQNKQHLLLIYTKQAAGDIHFPTITDGHIYPYFKINRNSRDNCSRTLTWNPGECIYHGLLPQEVVPRPEGVHKPVTLNDLIRPVRLIK
jgi:hypothetical protein